MDSNFPDKLLNYRITERLSSRPNGETFKAYDPDGERDVVLKLVSAAMSARLSFKGPGLTLMRNLSSIDCEVVSKIFDIQSVEDRILIVRPFIEGVSFKSIIEEEKMGKDLFMLRARRVVLALTRVHREKMLLGNLRPGNIFLDKMDNIKFVDYGLLTGFSADDVQDDEEAGEWLQYLPPEIIRGTELGRHSDLYALGVLFFRMVAGTHPFGAGSFREIIDRIRANVFIREALPETEVGGDTILLIEKLLSPRPDDRISSASELYATLDAMTEESSRVASPSPPKWDSSAPRVYILVSAAIVIVSILWILLVHHPR